MKVSGKQSLLLPALQVICLASLALSQVAELKGTSWQLVKFQGSDDKALTPDDRSKYTLAFAGEGRVSVRIDCNRGFGTWKSSGANQLEFGPLALTRAMCPPAALNDRLAKDWEHVRSYIVKDGHLFLSLMADGGTYEFEPLTPRTATEGKVTGTAIYRERMALPTSLVFEAILEDVSKADAPAEELGRVRLEHPGNPPVRFEITYDPAGIDPGHRYAVRGRILAEGKLLFTTVRRYAVLTAGHGSEVTLQLRRAKAPGAPAKGTETGPSEPVSPAKQATASLENTYWKLMSLSDTAVAVAAQQSEPHFVLHPESHRVNGSVGCNRLVGGYELNGEQLKFSQVAGTKMACPQGMETEEAFLQALGQVTTWKVTGEQLELFDSGGKVLARFESRYMK